MEVRDRYAPSPTGLQHIGGLRTALFNYLFAKSQNGKFILRLEDTDRTRFDPVYVENLYASFDWLGFHWDEGPDVGGPAAPYVQSERFETYKNYAHDLLEKGAAYYCFCTPQRLDALRAERAAAHSSAAGYDRLCRDIPAHEAAARAAREPHTIRLKIPLGAATVFDDLLLGRVEWQNDDVNPDPVLLKSDGFPTYHLANVVDDHLMGITHVLRAQEWLASTPLHVILYRAFGWDAPLFCHLPMVMGQDGKKLSKRHGATSVDEFRKKGFLPEALVNYVALLGASYEEGKEMYSLPELCARFSLEKLNKAPAVFDYKKLEWYNAQYIRMKPDGELAALALPYAVQSGLFGAEGRAPSPEQRAVFSAAMPLVKERAVFLSDIPDKLGYLFAEPPVPAACEFIPKKSNTEEALRLLKIGRELAAVAAELDDAAAECAAKKAAEKEGVKLGDLLTPLRVALTGSRVSPPLFGSIRLLGRELCLARIDRALEKLPG
ncbi:MAG: glutamate--tRNA ligase [Spirochaetaceae bacterium]|jgi:glutamyl-tRNA synthetase|nr:glutamate--tRNA ligase [Spirochaetaceae bacterium]